MLCTQAKTYFEQKKKNSWKEIPILAISSELVLFLKDRFIDDRWIKSRPKKKKKKN